MNYFIFIFIIYFSTVFYIYKKDKNAKSKIDFIVIFCFLPIAVLIYILRLRIIKNDKLYLYKDEFLSDVKTVYLKYLKIEENNIFCSSYYHLFKFYKIVFYFKDKTIMKDNIDMSKLIKNDINDLSSLKKSMKSVIKFNL